MECRFCGEEWERSEEPGEPLLPPVPCYNCTMPALIQTIAELNAEIHELMEDSGRSGW